jgi:hypothetical protein
MVVRLSALRTSRCFTPQKHFLCLWNSFLNTVNNFIVWLHSSAVLHCSEYVESQDGDLSVLSSQQEAVASMWYIQKGSHWQSRMPQFEQCENVKFCPKLGKTTSKAFQIIKQVHNEEALGCNAVFMWHGCFDKG